MADSKLTGLVELDPPALEDMMYIVDDPSGVPVSNKVTLQNMMELAPHWVDRGDPAAVDFDLTTPITTDGAWHDLDLSGIVPAGATWVRFRCVVQDDVVSSAIRFRKNGNANQAGSPQCMVQVANVVIDYPVEVPCDSNRVIEYWATSTTFTLIQIIITGWYIDTVN